MRHLPYVTMPSIMNTMFAYRSTKVLELFGGNGMEKQKHFLANLHAMEEKLHVWSETTFPML